MMRFYNQQHRFYCGVDLHARTLSLCILDATGTCLLQRTIAAALDDFLQAIEPFRDGLAVACARKWRWRKLLAFAFTPAYHAMILLQQRAQFARISGRAREFP
jgi:hypothetical protein